MAEEIPKSARKKLGEFAGVAHEAALRRELAKVDEDFGRWRRGEIDSFELAARIHRFHDGPAREIYKLFAMARPADSAMLVAYSIKEGLLDRETIPPELWPYLEGWLQFYSG